jgi:hypothetical protein
VATNSWGTPEALGPDHPGLVSQGAPGELTRAVVAMLSRPGVAAEARREQRKRIGTFSLDACVAKHEEIYSRVAATK